MANDLTEELLPCPFCGNEHPFIFITFYCVVLRCSCGVEVTNGSACVMYERDKLPPELVGHTYELDGLILEKADGTRRNYPEHGMIGVSAPVAFAHAGLTKIWNKRVGNGQ